MSARLGTDLPLGARPHPNPLPPRRGNSNKLRCIRLRPSQQPRSLAPGRLAGAGALRLLLAAIQQAGLDLLGVALVVEAVEAVEHLAAGGFGDGEGQSAYEECIMPATGECLSELQAGIIEAAHSSRHASSATIGTSRRSPRRA